VVKDSQGQGPHRQRQGSGLSLAQKPSSLGSSGVRTWMFLPVHICPPTFWTVLQMPQALSSSGALSLVFPTSLMGHPSYCSQLVSLEGWYR
jgi:glucose dehydrogenase